MKKLTLTIVLLVSTGLTTQSQNLDNWMPKVPEKEFMFLETHWDYANTRPGDENNKEYGIHYGVEFGMRSYLPGVFGIEAKVLHENFPKLLGGYKVFGGGFGVFWVVGDNEQIMYYAGARLTPWVFRKNPNSGYTERSENIGLELKWTYTFNEKFYIGARLVHETANDMETIDRDLKGKIRNTVNFVLGFNLSKIGGYK